MATEKFSLSGIVPIDTKLETISIKAKEDPAEKRLRLRKEYLSFLVKELAAYLVSFLFLIAIGGYCCFVFIRYGVTSPEARVVFPLLTTLFGGVVGLIIGKASK